MSYFIYQNKEVIFRSDVLISEKNSYSVNCCYAASLNGSIYKKNSFLGKCSLYIADRIMSITYIVFTLHYNKC